MNNAEIIKGALDTVSRHLRDDANRTAIPDDLHKALIEAGFGELGSVLANAIMLGLALNLPPGKVIPPALFAAFWAGYESGKAVEQVEALERLV